MIREHSLRLLEKAIQKTLELDPDISTKIEPLRHKVIKIIISPLKIHFYMVFDETAPRLYKDYDTAPDTQIESTPLGLIRLSLLPASKVRSLFNNQIKISGDTLVGQHLKQLFDTLHIDWEGHLAQFTGDVVAYQLGSIARFGLDVKTRLQSSLNHQFTEYIHEEARLFPTREEIEDFMNDVDELSLRVARLEAHLNHDLANHEQHHSTHPSTEN